jgi:hypothetical protein
MRFVAHVSRQSLKRPYAPETDLTRRIRGRGGRDAVDAWSESGPSGAPEERGDDRVLVDA